MAQDIFKPQGVTKASKPDTGGAALREVPVFGIVKDNIDPVRCGRLRVYIDDMSGQDPDDANSWATVNYMSPFYGVTQGDAPSTGYGTYLQNPSSYGMWNSPPDIGTTVICIFINGDTNYGYWIGCVPKPEALYMVPAIGSAETVVTNEGEANSYGGATKLPVANINSNNDEINNSSEFYNQPKPVHSYLAGVLAQQGLIRDTIRGSIGTSAQRESPSRVGWGVNTPGRPIYEGGFTDENVAESLASSSDSALKIVSRRVGHSIVMDDGDLIGRDQLIRLRTSMGHQILMSDDGQTLFIIHANGQSYIELGKEGTIDMYATNSVNIRTQGDLNLHADNNININAKKDLNLYGENIKLQSDKKTEVKVGTDYATQVTNNHTVKVDGKMTLKSAGDAGFASSAVTYVNGSKVNLNTGEPSLSPSDVKPFTTVAHTDSLFDKDKGWAAAPASLLSIVTRAPAHAPWAAANQGVDVKVDNSAEANFPSAPSPAVAATNNSTPATPTAPVAPSIASTVPVTGAVSAAIPPNATTAIVGQIATTAQSLPNVATAIQSGAGIIQQAGANVAAVGQMAQTFQQMETGGVIKAGAAALANAQVQAGKTVAQALPPSLFTGKPGATDLTSYINNPVAQVQTAVAGLQVAQTQLTNAGVITGKESAGQIAGLVTSTATAGLGATVGALKNAASGALGSVTGGISNALGGAANNLLGSASSMLSAGNFAANMSSTLTGGMNSLASSLGGLSNSLGKGVSGLLDRAKGLAGSAFSAITNSFPKLKAGVPQNMKQIADDAVKAAQNTGTELSSGLASATSALTNAGAAASSIASGVASSATNALAGATTSLTNATTGALTTVTSATGTSTNLVTQAQSAVTSILPNSISTGLGALPGAQKAISTVVNNATGALNSIPGVSQLSGAMGQITASVTSGGGLGAQAGDLLNKLKNPGASLQALASAGLPAGAAAALNSAIGSLSSGGAIPIKLPTVGLNTTDRTGLTAQLSSVFGSTKIPVPNFAGNPATTGETSSTAEIKRLLGIHEQIDAIQKDIDAKRKVIQDLKKDYAVKKSAYDDLNNSLPSGDPQIDTALADARALGKKINDLIDEYDVKRAERDKLLDSLSTKTA
jgi:hypothetical protein